jgi:hypothetical protein
MFQVRRVPWRTRHTQLSSYNNTPSEAHSSSKQHFNIQTLPERKRNTSPWKWLVLMLFKEIIGVYYENNTKFKIMSYWMFK